MIPSLTWRKHPRKREASCKNNSPVPIYPPCREDVEPMPEEYFVEFCVPEAAISDIDARFPNRTP